MGFGKDSYQHLGQLLSHDGTEAFNLQCADRSDTALDSMRGDVPDVCLLEVPGTVNANSDIPAQILEMQRYAPVVVIVGSTDPELRAGLMRAGATDVLAREEMNTWQLDRSLRSSIERWWLERALQESQRRFEDIAEVATDWLWEMDENLRITFVSPRIGEITGFDPTSVLGKTRWEFLEIDPGQNPHWIQHKADLDAHRPFRNFCYSPTDQNGKTYHFKLNGKPVFDPMGAFRGYRGTGTDLTEELASRCRAREAESQLLQAQKLESIGQLAAGIAHEINTPTQYVGDNTHFLQDAFRDLIGLQDILNTLLDAARDGTVTDGHIEAAERALAQADIAYLTEEVPNAIAQSLEGVQRITRIVGAMKEFSHPGCEEKECVDISRIIDNTLTVASNEWKYVADLELDLDESVPPVPCYQPALSQVILNLVVNAAHAIAGAASAGSSERGTLRVSTRQAGAMVEIRITDTGTGIPEAISGRVFDQFFTTKDVGKGTGQGLAIAHSTIVDQHGGTLSFETQPGIGTTFIIRLPLADTGTVTSKGAEA